MASRYIINAAPSTIVVNLFIDKTSLKTMTSHSSFERSENGPGTSRIHAKFSFIINKQASASALTFAWNDHKREPILVVRHARLSR